MHMYMYGKNKHIFDFKTNKIHCYLLLKLVTFKGNSADGETDFVHVIIRAQCNTFCRCNFQSDSCVIG